MTVRSWIPVLFVAAIGPVSAHADAGFPGLGPRPRPAIHRGQFYGLEAEAGYAFFLHPGGVSLDGDGVDVPINAGVKMLAVPKTLINNESEFRPEWLNDPRVLQSEEILQSRRYPAATSTPTIIAKYRVLIDGKKLSCVKYEETTHYPPDDRPSARRVLGFICGGCVLVVGVGILALFLMVRHIVRHS